jgi:hypothetical protein
LNNAVTASPNIGAKATIRSVTVMLAPFKTLPEVFPHSASLKSFNSLFKFDSASWWFGEWFGIEVAISK